MGVYKVDGTEVTDVYSVSGNELLQAYDIDGNELLPTEITMTVMSYNVQWWAGLSGNETMQRSIFETYNPEIIGFQEFQRGGYDYIPELALNLFSSSYPSILMGNYGNKNAIVSKYQLTGFTTIPFTQQATGGQSICYAEATIGDKTVMIVSSHLATSDDESVKVNQAQELFQLVQNFDSFILFGDFNTVCKSVNDTEYTTIMKQFIDAGYNSANCSLQHGFIDTWTSGTSLSDTWYPTDHIITSADIEISEVIADLTKVDYAAITGQSIDHIPLIAVIKIPM